MPLDRADAVVIGAGVEGLTAALTLARAGRQVVCIDRHESTGALGRPDEAWIAPATLRVLGLQNQGLRLTVPHPHLSMQPDGWTVMWPNADRTARTLAEPSASAFRELAADLCRWRAAMDEPGAAARAMLASLDLVRQDESDAAGMGFVLRSSAQEFLARRIGNPALAALLVAMASRQTPANPGEAGSAAILLGLAPFFDEGAAAPRPPAGGQAALIAALAKAFREAGGHFALGREVSEIVMEREAVSGVALVGGGAVKAPLAIAALAPRRLAQGLLSTRRFGRILSGLRAAPRRAQAMARIAFGEPPALPDQRLGLWRNGVSVWLAATMENLRSAASAQAARRLHETPVVELRFEPGLRAAIAVSPFCPGELGEGPWTAAQRDTLLAAILGVVKAQWPHAHAQIEDAQLLRPRAPQTLGATGAIFGAGERMPDLDAMLALSGETPGPILKGLHLGVARGFEPDGQAGLAVAAQAAARMRA